MGKKLKTNKAIAKRFKITKKWKFIHNKAWKSHLLTHKGASKKKYKYWKVIAKVEVHKIKALIPYS